MRLVAFAALAFALAACGGGGDGGELAARDSRLSEAQIEAALGPADQSDVQDALPGGTGENEVEGTGNGTVAENAAAAEDGEVQ